MVNNKKITVQIAALNEGKSIPQVLKNISREGIDEVLVVDGHSTDNTVEIAKSFGCRVLVQPGKGFGDAHMHGFKNATGDIIVVMDADYSQDPKDIPRLLAKLNEGYDVAMGSRYMPGAKTEEETPVRFIGNKMFTFLTNLVHGMKTSDCLYFFIATRKEVLNSLDLKSKGFAFCVEALVKMHKAGYKIGEVPCVEHKRFADESRVNAFTDGLRILWQMLWW